MDRFCGLALVVLILVIAERAYTIKLKAKVTDTKKYHIPGQNATFEYEIYTEEKDKDIDPTLLKIKVKLSKTQTSTLYKLILTKDGTSIQNTSIQNTKPTKKLFKYKNRTDIQYERPYLRFFLRNLIDTDFDRGYEIEVQGATMKREVWKHITLLKAVRPTIYEGDQFSDSTYINLDQSDEYKCRAEGTPDPKVTWKSQAGDVLGTAQKEASLKIEKANKKNTQKYECVAENIGGVDKKDMYLVVAYKEHVGKPMKHIKVIAGGTIDEECQLDGYPNLSYEWRDPNDKVIRSNKKLVMKNFNQFGNYTCDAKNRAGKLSYTLQVEREKLLPKIDASPYFPSTTVPRGVNFEFMCRASGYPSPNSKWWINSGYVTDGEVLKFNGNVKSAGVYACIATNEVGSVNKTMDLTVSYLELSKKEATKKSVNITEGGNGVLVCNIDGVPSVTYEWIEPTGKVIGRKRTHELEKVQLNATGKYTCKAKNLRETIGAAENVLTQEVHVKVTALPTTVTTTTTSTTKPPTTTTTVASTAEFTPVVITEPVKDVVIPNTSPRLVVQADSDKVVKSVATTTAAIFPCTILFCLNMVYHLAY